VRLVAAGHEQGPAGQIRADPSRLLEEEQSAHVGKEQIEDQHIVAILEQAEDGVQAA
jgi:hypothetical protein